MRLPAVLALFLLPALAAGALTPGETRGKQIYAQGTSSSGVEIKAVLGEGGAEVPASALPCAGCHGLDGHGGKEGGVRPSDLTREALGRRRPPYDDHLLVRAVTLGIGAAGNQLHVAMPRYRLTQQDAADLLAYLKRLGHEAEPGLAPDAVHLGVLLPGGARQEGQAEAVRAAVTARCAELNRGGGVYGRRLVPHFVEIPETPAERAARLRELFAGEPVFALLGVALSGAEAEAADVAGAAGVPLILALAPRPREDFPLDRYVFYLTPGLAEQAAALVELAARQLPQEARSLAIVRPAAAELADLAAATAETARRSGFTVEPAGQAAGAAAILLLDGGAAARELLERAQALGRHPLILLPASLAGENPFAAVPEALGDRLFVSLPILPAVHSTATQRAAVAAAEVLIEGLKRAGREVSREKLVATLEKLYRFDAGLGAPVTFGPNRRIGARGAFIAAVDLPRHILGQPVSWIDLSP